MAKTLKKTITSKRRKNAKLRYLQEGLEFVFGLHVHQTDVRAGFGQTAPQNGMQQRMRRNLNSILFLFHLKVKK